ncbi:hypothetical protein DFS34DRAFT_616548 [Phlyctochytrium arcticum]|nr:hypothetical protein DFS34DRAFT_616548 [Phlyctochytrium arcticum]
MLDAQHGMSGQARAPLSISNRPGKGRSFIVDTCQRAGTVLLRTRPYAVVPDCGSRRNVCGFCVRISLNPSHTETPFNQDNQKGPSSSSVQSPAQLPFHCACEQVFYCSEECQTQDWQAFHNVECGFLKDLFLAGVAVPLLQDRIGSDSETEDLVVPNREGFDSYTLDFLWMLMRIVTRRACELASDSTSIAKEKVSRAESPASDTSSAGDSDESAFSEHAAVDGTSRFSEESSERTCSAGSATQAGAFKDVWELCSNATLFPRERITHFIKVAKCLASFVRTALIPFFETRALHPFKIEEADLLPPASLETVLSEHEPLPSLEASLLDLICKEECNSFGLYSFTYKGSSSPRQGYALGLYSLAVFFNHSCVPNTGHITRGAHTDPEGAMSKRGIIKLGRKSLPVTPSEAWDLHGNGAEMLFYALKDLSAGEEALISYVELGSSGDQSLESGRNRRKMLNTYFFFQCDCRRCDDDRGNEESMRTEQLPPGLSDSIANELHAMSCNKSNCRGWFAPENLGDRHNRFLDATQTSTGSERSIDTINKRNDSGKDLKSLNRLQNIESSRGTAAPHEAWICEGCGRTRA